MTSIELLIDGLDFGEGPRWHNGLLWYSDFFQHRVYTVSLDGKREVILDLGDEQPSGLGWLPNGDLLVVAMLGRKILRYDGTKTTVHAELDDIATWHCNDMVVSKSGTAYVGNFGYDYGSEAPAVTANLAAVFQAREMVKRFRKLIECLMQNLDLFKSPSSLKIDQLITELFKELLLERCSLLVIVALIFVKRPIRRSFTLNHRSSPPSEQQRENGHPEFQTDFH